MAQDDDHEDEGSLVVFGRDLSTVPCFKYSYIYGISSGIGAGLLYFLFTSRVTMSTHVAMGSFATVTLGYWFYCRYQWSKQKFVVDQIRHSLVNQVMYEGSEVEKRVREEIATGGIKEEKA